MADTPDDYGISAARKAGYNDREIADFLAERMGADITPAREAGYHDSEIVAFLAPKPKVEAPEPTPEPKKATIADDFERGLKSARASTATLGGVIAGARLSDIEAAKAKAERGDYLSPMEREQVRQYDEAKANTERQFSEGIGKGIINRREAEALPMSPGYKAFQEAEGVSNKLKAFWKAPVDVLTSMIAEGAVASAPSLAAAVAAGPGGAIPAAIAGGTVAGGQAYLQSYADKVIELLQKRGVDVDNREALMAALSDPKIVDDIKHDAALSAIPQAAAGAASMAVAPLVMAPAKLAARPVAQQAVNIPAQAAVQGALAATGEAGSQAIIGEPLEGGRILAAGIGGAAQGPLDATIFTATHGTGAAFRARREATTRRILDAPSTDGAIAAAQQAIDSKPIDIPTEAANLREYGNTQDRRQAEVLEFFGGLNDGTVEGAPDGTYYYRQGDKVSPLKAWNPDTPPVEGVPTISPDLVRAQRAHYEKLGVDVVYFEDNRNIPFDGAVDPNKPNTLFLSNNPERNAAQVAAHELTHVLESTTLPDGTNLGDVLHQQIRAGLTEEGRAYAEERFMQTAPKREAFGEGEEGDARHADAVTAHLIRELGADIGGEAPKFPEFLPRVVDEIQSRYGMDVAKGVVRKLIEGIQQTVRTLREFFSKPEEMAEYGQPETVSQKWVSNLDEIHGTLAKMYAERYGATAEKGDVVLATLRGRAEVATRQAAAKRGATPGNPTPRSAEPTRPLQEPAPAKTPAPAAPEAAPPVRSEQVAKERAKLGVEREAAPPKAEAAPAPRKERLEQEKAKVAAMKERARGKTPTDLAAERIAKTDATRTANAIEQGRAAAESGQPRTLPRHYLADYMKPHRAEWFQAYDAAKAEKTPEAPQRPGEQGMRDMAQRLVNAENTMIETIMERGELTRPQAEEAFKAMQAGKMLNRDAVGGRYTVKHGRMMEPEFLRQAAGVEPVRAPEAARGAAETPKALFDIEKTSAYPTRGDDVNMGAFKGFASTNDRGRLAVHAYGKTEAEARANAVAKLDAEFQKREQQRAVDRGQAPAGAPAAAPDRFANNKIFTSDKVEAARARLREKLKGNQFNSGFDPEIMLDGITIAGAHIEAGLRDFASFSKAMIQDIGEGVRPYLLSFYEGVRNYPGLDTKGMTTPEEAARLHAAEGRTTSEEAKERTNAGHQGGVAEGDTGSQPAGVRAPEGERPTGRDSGEPGGRVPAERGRGDGSGNRRAEPGEQPEVRAGRLEAGADVREPERGGEGRGAEPGDRANRQPLEDYRYQPGELTRDRSWRGVAERNVEAVETAKRIAAEDRPATPEERALLARFTGWGASEIANGVFANPRTGEFKPEWRTLGERLKNALTEEEYAAARRTTQYAHYTSEGVIRAIYNALERLGFGGGRILEPGMGIGLFKGLMPEGMAARSQYHGIEYDPLTATIAKALYPQSNIQNGDFTATALPKNYYDAAIGNPPFSSTKILNDPEYRSRAFALHDYFFAKTIDRVKPGGVVVFVTSKGTMDKANDRARQYLADRANLLGAIRLPQTAFKDNAGTEVVTDVLFLQKRAPGEERTGADWLGTKEVQTPQGPAAINEYFANHPEMVLGEHALTGSMYRANEYTVVPRPGDIEKQFAEAVQNLPENVYRPERGSIAEQAAVQERDFNPKAKKEGTVYIDDKGQLRVLDQGSGAALVGRMNSSGKMIPLKAKEVQFLKDYTGLRDALKQAQYDQLHDGNWQESLAALNRTYDDFVKAHGNILAHTVTERENPDGSTTVTTRWKNSALLNLDAENALVRAIEKIQSDGTIVRGKLLDGRTLNKPTTPQINDVQDALLVQLNQQGKLDMREVARMAGLDEAEAIKQLGDAIYNDPASGWTTADAYLSGDVVSKLKEARAAARLDPSLERNVAALEAVQPAPLAPADISAKLGAHWIPASDVRSFASEVLGERMDVTYSPIAKMWSVEGGRGNVSEWNPEGISAADLLEKVLNGKQISITERVSDGKGGTTTQVNLAATEAANAVAKKMDQEFRRWVWSSPQRAERLANFYNEHFNNIVPRSFDGQHLTLPGISSRFNLYPHQKRAIWRVIQDGMTYLAHTVGAGKTFTMIAAGMEERRLGLIKKPMYVVPNHMLSQFAREFQELYPTAHIMVADEENFHTANRRQFVARAALNDPDAIIITHSAFGRIGLSDEYRTSYIQRMIDEYEAIKDEVDKGDRVTIKQIERRIEQLENRLEGMTDQAKKDKPLTFEELGVDRLYVDEFHEFRKLDFPTNRGNIKGIDPNGSNRSMDLHMKVQYLNEKNPGRSLVAASGTPVTNTMGELFTTQRFMQPEQLRRDGLDSFDAWANQFGDVVDGFEQNPSGGYEVVSRFARFVNVPDLMRRVRSFMDILTSDQLGSLVERPTVKGGNREIVVTPVPAGYKEYQQALDARIKAIKAKKGPPKPGDDIILSVISDGRFSAIDMRFVDPTRPPDPDSKLNRLLDDVIEAYHGTKDWEYHTDGNKDPVPGGTLMIFSDIGLGEASAKNRGFDMKDWIVKRLTEGGVDPNHIAFMRDNNTSAKKEKLFSDMRQGTKRIMIGGKDMETGVNAQKRLTQLFHLDAPWFPASVEQREGRIVRQGNQNKEVQIRAYATKGSYDSTMWGMNARKQRFITQALQGSDKIRSMDDVSEASSFEMASALASGDERYLKMAGLRSDVERLGRLYSAYEKDQRSLRSGLAGAQAEIKADTDLVGALQKAIEQRTDVSGDNFAATIEGAPVENREDFGNKLFTAFKKLADSHTEGEQKLGQIGGFDLLYNGVAMKGSGDFLASVELDVPGHNKPLLNYPIDPEQSVKGLAARATHQVVSLDHSMERAQSRLQEAERKIKQIQSRIGGAFPEMAEMSEKRAALEALESELATETAAKNAAEAAAAQQLVEGNADLEEGPAMSPRGPSFSPRKPSPEDRGEWNGRRFWSGAFDTRDGQILEVHPFQRAKDSDFHHSMYFSPHAQEAMKEGEAAFFWVDRDGKINTEWREGKAAPEIIRRIEEQITTPKDEGPSFSPRQTETPEFKKWFGDSKVVDEEGRPLVVYRGDGGARTKPRTDAPIFATYFSDSPKLASSYAARKRSGANVTPVYLSLKNPLEVTGSSFHNLTAPEDIRYWSSRYGQYSTILKGEVTDIDTLTVWAKQNGYDGLIARDIPDPARPSDWKIKQTTYVAFSPEQIKSAIGNRGTFDASNPDIRYSPRVGKKLLDRAVEHFGVTEDMERAGFLLRDGRKIDFSTSDDLRMWDRYEHSAIGKILNEVDPDIIRNHPDPQDFIREFSRQTGAMRIGVGRWEIAVDAPSAPTQTQIREIVRYARQTNRDLALGHYTDDPNRNVILQRPTVDEVNKFFAGAGTSPQDDNRPLFSPRVVGDNPSRTYTPEQIKARERIRGVEQRPLGERLNEWREDLGKKLIREIFDPFVGLKERDPAGYLAARMANSVVGAVDMFNSWGTLKFEGPVYATDKQTGGPVALIRDLGKEAHDFIDWVAANRAERLKAEDRENLFRDEDIAALKSLNKGTLDFDYTLSDGKTTRSREAAYLDALKRLDTANRNALDLAVDAGLLKRKNVDALWSDPYYVPFYRQAEEDNSRGFVGGHNANGMVKQKAFERLKGGTQKLTADLWQNAFGNWAHMIDAAIRNKAANQVLETALKDGIVEKVSTQRYEHQMTKAEKADVVWTMVDGERTYWQVNDPFTLKAITALDFIQTGTPLMGIARAAKRLLQTGVAASPIFQLRNLIRDTEQATAVSPIAKNVFRNLADGAGQLDIATGLTNVARAVAGQQLKDPTISRSTADAIAGGATMRYAAGVDQRFYNADTYLDSPTKIGKFWDYFRKVGHASADALRFSENMNRLALYSQLGDQGAPAELRAYQARDLSDFTLVGASPIIRHVVEMVPYLNAWLQGLYKVGRAAADADRNVTLAVGGKVAVQLTKRLAAVTLGMVGLNLALDAIYADDEDYQNRTEYDRNSNFWFKVGGTEFRVPMGFEVAALARMAALWTETLYDKNVTAGRAWKNTLSILGTQMALNPTPQIVKPLVDLYGNETRTGTPIETAGMERLRPEYRSAADTSSVSKGVSEVLNKGARLVGGENARAFSPVQLDYLAQAYAGWLGTSSLQIADTVVRTMTGQPDRPDQDMMAKFTGGLVSNTPTTERSNGRYVDMLYQQGDAIREAYATYRELAKRGQTEEARDYLEANRENILRHRLFDRVIGIESRLNDQIRTISASPSLTGEQKRLRIMELTALKNRAARSIFAPETGQ